ncbi:MAG: GGDEF domain-containing protein [Gammaproteobacteria bacterium]|nr:GGDEF domain-containing protein [Gammaproteobacteria bacterium]
MSSSPQSTRAFGELWSVTRFDGAELSRYAETLIFADTRRGLMTLGLVSMVMLAGAALAYALLGFDNVYVYTCSILAVLSLHMTASARAVNETRVVYLLGTTLLVVNGLAFVLLAHHSGALDAALFAAVILLFLVMPLVPWGLREALLIVLLVYLMFTLSTLSVDGRFDAETLWMLQLAMIAGGGTTLTVIARNILIRRDDIKARFELEKARDRMARLSLKDPLTGAWNRRFLDQNFTQIRADYSAAGQALQFALIDIDDFKVINDTGGHDYGDLVLVRLAANYLALFRGGEHLVRLGGDEFLLLLPKRDDGDLIAAGATALRTDPQLFSGSAGSQVGVSIGLLEVPPGVALSLDDIYRRADQALYRAKAGKGQQQRAFISRAVVEAGA